MQRMPPTTDPLSRNYLEETFVWIIADKKEREKERHAPRTQTALGTCCGPSLNIPLRPRVELPITSIVR
jgi:hypothetical protein